MLPRKIKIGASLRIEHILKKGQYIRGKYLNIKFLPNRLSGPRFAFVISSKFAKTAVERNLIRRRAYEAIGFFLKPGLPNPQKTCYDVVVLCRTAAPTLTYKLIKQDLENLLSKLLL